MKALETSHIGGNLAKSVDYLQRQNGTKCQIGEDLKLETLVAAYEHRASRYDATQCNHHSGDDNIH